MEVYILQEHDWECSTILAAFTSASSMCQYILSNRIHKRRDVRHLAVEMYNPLAVREWTIKDFLASPQASSDQAIKPQP